MCHWQRHCGPQPELASFGHAVIVVVCAVVTAVCVVLYVSVGDVEAEALLTPPLLFDQPRLSRVTGQSVLVLQAAQRQRAVDGLEDNGAHHLKHKCRNSSQSDSVYFPTAGKPNKQNTSTESELTSTQPYFWSTLK